MSTSAPSVDALRAINVWFERGKLHVALSDGREIACPLAMFPRLAAATPKERADWVLTGRGEGIHWPAVDEDLSTSGLFEGRSAAPPAPTVLRARGAFLRAARHASGLTQAQLAEALGKSQALVSLAEQGKTWTGEPYRREVLKACGLPEAWEP